MERKFAKLVLTDGRILYLRVTSESKKTISGVPLNREGDELTPSKGFTDRLEIIVKTVIRSNRIMKMNKKYGRLEF